ncbi:hypothetical protein BU14_0208s0022 [Porphyra umbilicalis]|uniref:L-serine ammonia-lyase n=1 Tax=Porphyra umbilicalis TaxID=2786 RepID=A0A1X6P5E0_PORUM|nr:hypothetical protein BU14_0208s0022 [Porphyra umbilicalis]|eukprot:OSX76064.1 hypothetical protein BU14_0208s0022 [Porphyra umbilicalis]
MAPSRRRRRGRAPRRGRRRWRRHPCRPQRRAAAAAAAWPPRGSTVYVSQCDDAWLWEGASTLVGEMVADGPRTRLSPPAAVVVSARGGGLLLGTARGLARAAAAGGGGDGGDDGDATAAAAATTAAAWGRTTHVAAETNGAASFAAMAATGGATHDTLPAITSLASFLSAVRVAVAARTLARDGSVGGGLTPDVVLDRAAVEGCVALAVEQRVLVEVACGAAVAGGLEWAAAHRGGGGGGGNGDAAPPPAEGGEVMVIVVCGGNMASLALLAKWVALTGSEHPEFV